MMVEIGLVVFLICGGLFLLMAGCALINAVGYKYRGGSKDDDQKTAVGDGRRGL